MFDHLLSDKALDLRAEVRDLVKWVPRDMILDMDRDRIRFPKDFLREAGRRNLMGCRYPRQVGGTRSGLGHHGHGHGGSRHAGLYFCVCVRRRR